MSKEININKCKVVLLKSAIKLNMNKWYKMNNDNFIFSDDEDKTITDTDGYLIYRCYYHYKKAMFMPIIECNKEDIMSSIKSILYGYKRYVGSDKKLDPRHVYDMRVDDNIMTYQSLQDMIECCRDFDNKYFYEADITASYEGFIKVNNPFTSEENKYIRKKAKLLELQEELECK